jgi:hypothetical protein
VISTRCTRCSPRKPSRHARGYDAAWKRFSRAVIAAKPWCTDCGTSGTLSNPLTGDHLRRPAHTVADVAVRCRRHNSARGPAPVFGRAR